MTRVGGSGFVSTANVQVECDMQPNASVAKEEGGRESERG